MLNRISKSLTLSYYAGCYQDQNGCQKVDTTIDLKGTPNTLKTALNWKYNTKKVDQSFYLKPKQINHLLKEENKPSYDLNMSVS